MSAIVIADKVRIPAWVSDLESFRRWARSGEMPEHGWFSFLNGELWVDTAMEQVFWHNLLKTEFVRVLGGLVKLYSLGYFFSDRMLLSHPGADLSTEPDGLFAFWDTVKSGRLRLVEGAEEGFVELEGTPDMALEIVSPTTERKDTEVLRELYGRAGITEYWLVDVRRQPLRFEILTNTSAGYVAVRNEDGWLASTIFHQAFRLSQQLDPLGHPSHTLEVRA